MKKYFMFIAVMLIYLISCRMPVDSLGEIKIIQRLETIDTGGNCLDLDIDDSLLVAAANYNGFFSYKIYDENGQLSPTEIFHGTDMAPNLGDDRITKVLLSKKHDLMVLFDPYDKIYFAKKDGTQITYMGDGQYDCAGGAWHDVIIVDKEEEVIVFALVNHQSSEESAQTAQNVEYLEYSKSLVWVSYDVNSNTIGQTTGDWCEYSINFDYIANDIFYSNSDYIIVSYRELGVRIFESLTESTCYNKIESKSVEQKFDIYSSDSTVSAGSWSGSYIGANEDKILLILELDKVPLEISDIKIIGTNGEEYSFEFDATNSGEIINSIWIEELEGNFYNIKYNSSIDIAHYELKLDAKIISTQDILYDPITEFISQNDYDTDNDYCLDDEDDVPPGLGGYTFESEGGINPNIATQFDSPGEVEFVFAEGSNIFAGLRSNSGCVMTQLDVDGTIINTEHFAVGNTIKGMHHDNGLLALAAGNDGILLYKWNSDNISFMGRIETSYANNVKVSNNIIFAATKEGIEIIQIDY